MKFFVLLAFGLLLSPSTVLAQQPQNANYISPDWLTFSEALNAAEVSGRTVLVDVYAPWCPWCAKLQTEVYADPAILSYLKENFETARLNIEEKEEVIQFKGFELTSPELAAGLGAEATPTVVFLSSAGEYITRVPGFVEAEEFMHVLRYISTGSYQIESFQDYKLRNH